MLKNVKCMGRNLDPMESHLVSALSYLESLHAAGKANSTINIHRSMLSKTLPPIYGMVLGKHHQVTRIMKGIYNKAPPRARYERMWDVNLLLE